MAASAVVRDAVASGWPSRPVHLIVPFPQGQAVDVIARIVARRLAAIWNQDVVVQNHGGNSGIPAMVKGKSATPDGYTLTVASSGTLVINPALFPDLPYRPLVDFVPVSNLFLVPLVIAGHPSFPASSFNDFIAMVQREPGKLVYASPGQGSTQHLTMELLKLRAGLDIAHVPYVGSAAAVNALVAGEVRVIMDTAVALMATIGNSKAKPFAVTTARRALPPLDFIPPIADTITGFDVAAWGGIAAPAKTPPEIVLRVAIDVQAVLRETAVVRELGDNGTPAEFSAFIRKELEIWAQAVRATGTKPAN